MLRIELVPVPELENLDDIARMEELLMAIGRKLPSLGGITVLSHHEGRSSTPGDFIRVVEDGAKERIAEWLRQQFIVVLIEDVTITDDPKSSTGLIVTFPAMILKRKRTYQAFLERFSETV